MWSSNSLAEVVIDFETTYATSPTGTAISGIQIPFLTCDLKEDQPPRQSNILGAGRHAAQPFYGNRIVSGTLTGPLDLIAIGYILKMILGAPTTTGSGDPYTHTFKIGSSTPSFLVEKGFTDNTLYYLFNGCKANGFSIRVGKDNQLVYSVPIVGAKETEGTSAYDSDPTDVSKPAVELHVGNISAMTEGGSANATIEEIEFNFMNNTRIGYPLASAGAGGNAAEGSPTIEGRIKGLFTADAILLKGRNHTESSLTITLTSGSHSLQFLVNELQYGHNSPAIDGPGGTMLDLPFIGYYQGDAAASDFEVILINSQASYA
jgi:hypothetical protein